MKAIGLVRLSAALLCITSAARAQDDAPGAPPPPADAPPAAASPTIPANASPAPTRLTGVTVTARRPTTLTGVTVVAQGWCPQPDPTRYPADRDPSVVDSYPAQGAIAPPGAITVRISFDAPMTCFWDVAIDGGLDDPCAKTGAWALPARKTFVTRCTLEPKTHYVFHFRRTGGYGFVGLSGRNASGFDLAFDTSEDRPRSAAAPSLDPHPNSGEAVRAYVACTDEGGAGDHGACQRALIDPDAPPAS